MRWTIGILTIPKRKDEFDRLLHFLKCQVDYVASEDIEILVDDSDCPIGEKRQWCLDNAQGEYFNFIDDDDMVAHDYVESIYRLLDGEVDYIGFRLQLYIDGVVQKPTYHSLRYPEWYDDEDGFYRNVSHLNPIRTALARKGRFDGEYGEDFAWSKAIKPETEHFINRTMYHYYYSPEKSEARLRLMRLLDEGGLYADGDGWFGKTRPSSCACD